MKKLLLTLPLFLAFLAQAEAQTANEPAPLSKKEIEARRKAEAEEAKRQKKRYEAEEKERLKYPARIQIAAPSDRVGAILVRRMTEAGYQLAEEGKYRLVFQREVTGFRGSLGAAMMGGDSPPLWTAAFTLTELSGATNVTVDLAVYVRRRFGTPHRTDMNKHKDSRRDLDALLQYVKMEAEAAREEKGAQTPSPVLI